ncbi:rhodanese domain-containing protein [Roseibium sp. TrichSKD4]|uniref:rhodanese domain-containing protein n=1 Tax=Roseibium sp. TrichSKD4 TaxID=744980 RepID=UPI0001E5718A|nr:rhodanese domain-containing protein [Roseibium sp. TrichSKD4]EFO29639.1 rhodanese domain-containing protein [Roseibium sp. TrichSKD4]
MTSKLKVSFADLVAQARAAIEEVSTQDAIALVEDPNVQFVDLRDIRERFRHEPIKTLHSIKGVQQPPAKENKVKDGKDD